MNQAPCRERSFMDIVALVIAGVMFALLVGLVYGIDRI